MYIGFTPAEANLNNILSIHTSGVTAEKPQTNAPAIEQQPQAVVETNGDIGIAEYSVNELESITKEEIRFSNLSHIGSKTEDQSFEEEEYELYEVSETDDLERIDGVECSQSQSDIKSPEISCIYIEIEASENEISKWKIEKSDTLNRDKSKHSSENRRCCPPPIPIRIVTPDIKVQYKLDVPQAKRILNKELPNLNAFGIESLENSLLEEDIFHYTYNYNGRNNLFGAYNTNTETGHFSRSQTDLSQIYQMSFLEKIKNLLRFRSVNSCDIQQSKRKRSSDDSSMNIEKHQKFKYRKVENKFPKYIENQLEDDDVQMIPQFSTGDNNIFKYRSSTPIWNKNRMEGNGGFSQENYKQRKSMFIPPEKTQKLIKNNSYADIEFSDDDEIEIVKCTKQTSENVGYDPNLKLHEAKKSIPLSRIDQQLFGRNWREETNVMPGLINTTTSKPTYASVLKQIDCNENSNGKHLNAKDSSLSATSSSSCTPIISSYNTMRKSFLTASARSILAQEKIKDEREQYRQLLEQMVPKIYGTEKSIFTADKYNSRSPLSGKRQSLGKAQSSIVLDSEHLGPDKLHNAPRGDTARKVNVTRVVIDDSDDDSVVETTGIEIAEKVKSVPPKRYTTNNTISSASIVKDKTDTVPFVTPVNSLEKHLNSLPQLKIEWLENLTIKWNEKKKQRSQEVKETFETAEKLSAERRIAEIEIGERLRNFQIIDPDIIVVDEFPEPEEVEEVFELTAEQQAKVKRAVYGPPDEVLISKFNLNITRRDIHTLLGHNWLNDEVINFYMSLLTERSEKKHDSHGLPLVYAMNTFFIPRLMQSGHSGVKRWTRKVDIFAKDIIPVPVHVGGVHWCMAIIHLKNRTIKYYDSMGTPNPSVLKALEQYLKDESLDKRKQPFDTSKFEIFSVEDVPRQMNGSDCGVFSCMFAEFITRNRGITFTQQHMEYFRNRMILEIVQGELIN